MTDPQRVEQLAGRFDVKQAVEPFMYAAQLTEQAFGSVPKFYIRATHDKVMTLSLQDRMISNWDVQRVFTLESGHFPLMSGPERLADVIGEAATSETELIA